jgi:solute carrier family 25 (mitochondrial oxoglutarate transporter), member 11
MNGGANLSPL